MESTQGLPLEVRLSAYLDGQLPEAEMNEIDAILASDEAARATFERLKLGSEFGARAFDRLLQEPVPLDLVRGIRRAGGTDDAPSGLAAIPDGAQGARQQAAVSWPRTIAASLLLFTFGGALGYAIGEQRDAGAPPSFANSRTWLDDVADYHRIYARQSRHLVEVPASEGAHIVTWLSQSTGVAFTLPDLSGQKLTFEGARLLVAGGKPTAQLVYRDQEGEVFAICFMQSEAAGEGTGLVETMRDDLGLVSWQKGNAAYVVIGPSADPDLERLAATVFSSI